MKIFRKFAMLLMAAVLGGVLASCENEGGLTPEPQEPELIPVTLECAGEFLEVSNSPLSRAEGEQELYYVQVYSLTLMEMGPDKDPYWYETPYAFGTFYSLSGVSVNLLAGTNYSFKVGIVIGGSLSGDPGKAFNYSSTSTGNMWIPAYHEAYYGELSPFSPDQATSVVIDTKRVSYAAKFVAEDLTEGSLDISVSDSGNMHLYSVTLTPENPVSDKIYSYSNNYTYAWRTAVYNPAETYKENYIVNVTWVKSENDRVPMGSYTLSFERNMRTTVRIKVENNSTNNGISVNKEQSPITDSSNEYYIQGGQVIQVPINPA